MRLTLLAKDPNSGRTGCKSVFIDEDGSAVVLAPEVDQATLAQLENRLPGETAVRLEPEILAAAVDAYRARQAG